MKRFVTEDKILNFLQQNCSLLATVAITSFAILIRVAGFNFESRDYIKYIKPWIHYMKEHGNIPGIVSVSANYTPPSLLLYGLLSYFPEALTLWAVKISSSIFDFITAFFSYKIMLNLTENIKKSLLVYLLILFCPTVFLNSAVWGQCDSIFTAFLLVSLFFFLKGKTKWSLFFFGLALSFKLQAIFILPFFVFMYAYRKWNIAEVLYSVVGFFTLNIPLWFLGIPMLQWAKVYLRQMHQYENLTLNAPTVYAIFPTNANIGIIFMLITLISLTFYILHSKPKCSKKTIILLFLACSSFIPFVLPHMHERYFYIADILSIIYVVYNSSKWLISFFIIFPSLITYTNYLYTEQGVFSLQVLSIIIGAGVICISRQLIKDIKSNSTYIDKRI